MLTSIESSYHKYVIHHVLHLYLIPRIQVEETLYNCLHFATDSTGIQNESPGSDRLLLDAEASYVHLGI